MKWWGELRAAAKRLFEVDFDPYRTVETYEDIRGAHERAMAAVHQDMGAVGYYGRPSGADGPMGQTGRDITVPLYPVDHTAELAAIVASLARVEKAVKDIQRRI